MSGYEVRATYKPPAEVFAVLIDLGSGRTNLNSGTVVFHVVPAFLYLNISTLEDKVGHEQCNLLRHHK